MSGDCFTNDSSCILPRFNQPPSGLPTSPQVLYITPQLPNPSLPYNNIIKIIL